MLFARQKKERLLLMFVKRSTNAIITEYNWYDYYRVVSSTLTKQEDNIAIYKVRCDEN